MNIIYDVNEFLIRAIEWFFANIFWFKSVAIAISFLCALIIFYFIIKLDYFSDTRDFSWWRLLGESRRFKKMTIKIWGIILKKIITKNPQDWIFAIRKADELLEKALSVGGFIGKNFEERLMKIDVSQIGNISEIIRIRKEVFEEIEKNPDLLEISKAKEFLREYRKAFRQFGLLD